MRDTAFRTDREFMPYDVVVVGAGPSGLSFSIKMKQLNPELNVCILEKGSEVGAHLLSGAVFEPRALNELIPDWKEKDAPLKVKVKSDAFYFMTHKRALRLPTPPQMKNHDNNYIISLGMFGRWLSAQAEMLGVEVFPGFAAAEVLYNEDGSVAGVATGDMGIGKNGEKTENYAAGMEIHARQTVFAEGCRGSCSKEVISKFELDKNSQPQTYGLGIKEIWEIAPENHDEGHTVHTIGWPLDRKTYGGSWLYHMADNKVSVGFVVGLDYVNPTLSPFSEMQRFKHHPQIAKILEGGRRISYGARTIVEGGFQSLPKLTFPGGVLIGDSAGFLNVAKIKGNHTAMKSGMLAAEAIAELFEKEEGGNEATSYMNKYKSSWVYRELYGVRNIRPGFRKGLIKGLLNAAKETYLGASKNTLSHHVDHGATKPLADVKEIKYPAPDGKLSFDRLSSVFLAGTFHEENQPAHLKLKDENVAIDTNYAKFGSPEAKYCPAGVYEILEEGDKPKLQINAQNCIHCKACDIKDPKQNIKWTAPEGGGGPNYGEM
ncbi:MAG: electron transfer flavoprotein-ubiquinone oxidoreductase [Alphaproteobacteria bacterium]|nr:electron transfer flavoprotein-ubiquinone oxidoreductase [Alphaproteobacteria bacterium]